VSNLRSQIDVLRLHEYPFIHLRKCCLLGESDSQASFRVTNPLNPKKNPHQPWRHLPEVQKQKLEAVAGDPNEKGPNSSGKFPVMFVVMLPTTIFTMELLLATHAEHSFDEVSPVVSNFSAHKATIARLTKLQGNIVRHVVSKNVLILV